MTPVSGNVVAIMGATATGKSRLAMRMAEKFDGEIVSMDSRQVYRGLDIGTAKVSSEDRVRVRHHLIDILDPSESNSAGRHIGLVKQALEHITARSRLPILVGGTGLYFRAFFHGLIDAVIPDEEIDSIRRKLAGETTSALYDELVRVDPKRAGQLSANDRLRISRALEICFSTGKPFTQHTAEQHSPKRHHHLQIVLTMPRPVLRRRIADRTREMFRQGWASEVAGLLDTGFVADTPAMNSLGYRVIAEAILDGVDAQSTQDRVITLTQQYAKRQETFFRSMPDAHWIDVSREDAESDIGQRIEKWMGL